MQDDAIWVHQTLAGDRQAFDHLVQKYWKSVYAQILSTVRNSADAEDLTNDVFIEAYLDLRHLRRFSSFYNWLRQIARHRCQDWLRQRKEPCLSLDEVSNETVRDSPEDQLLQQEELHKTLEAIAALPEIDKALMRDFYLEDVPYKTLQGRYNLSKAAVNMRLFKARRKVREWVKELLSGIAVSPWRNIAKNLLTRGGMEAVKIGATMKMVIVGTAAVLVLGGIGVLVWRSHESGQELSKPVVSQAAQRATIEKRPFSRSFSKTPDEQDVETQIDETTAQPDAPEEDVEMAEAEAFLAFLDEMDTSDSSKETIDPEEQVLLRVFGLTRAEIEAKIPVLEAEIYAGLTRIVSLHDDRMRLTQAEGVISPEDLQLAKEKHAEERWLWDDLRKSKIPLYIQYRMHADLHGFRADNPMGKGGWMYEMQKSLTPRMSPLEFSYEGRKVSD